MAHNRGTGRKDANHHAIVAELEKRGFIVFDVSGLKSLGFDILVCQPDRYIALIEPERRYLRGFWMPMEIKTPDRTKQLTTAQQRAQQKAPIPIVSSVEDVLRCF